MKQTIFMNDDKIKELIDGSTKMPSETFTHNLMAEINKLENVSTYKEQKGTPNLVWLWVAFGFGAFLSFFAKIPPVEIMNITIEIPFVVFPSILLIALFFAMWQVMECKSDVFLSE